MDVNVLAANPFTPVYVDGPFLAQSAPAEGWIEHAGGVVTIGYDGDEFAFDNESLATKSCSPRSRWLPSWSARATGWSSWPTAATGSPSCGCPTAGRRSRPRSWEAPEYWGRDARDIDGWSVQTLTGPRPVAPDEPVVHVSWYEADAARWARRACPPRPSGRWWRPTSRRCRHPHRRPRPPRPGQARPAPDVPRRAVVRQRVAVDGQLGVLAVREFLRPVPWASTTASSWSTSRCCGVAPA